MAGLFLILLAALLFAHSWYFLGLYADARTMGLIAAALAVGIALSVSGTFDPVIMSKDATLPIIAFQGYVILLGGLRRCRSSARPVGLRGTGHRIPLPFPCRHLHRLPCRRSYNV